MELDDYLRATFRHRWLIGGTALLALGTALVLTLLKPVHYDVSTSFLIRRVNEPTTTDYQYDGYYVMQATDLVAQTVVSWFGTPSFVRTVYVSAGFDPAIRSIDEAARRFHPKKNSVQNVVVRFSDESREGAEKLARAVSVEIVKRVPELVTTVEGKAAFEVTAAEPVLVERKPEPGLSAGLGLVAGALIGLFLAAAVEGVKGRGA